MKLLRNLPEVDDSAVSTRYEDTTVRAKADTPHCIGMPAGLRNTVARVVFPKSKEAVIPTWEYTSMKASIIVRIRSCVQIAGLPLFCYHIQNTGCVIVTLLSVWKLD